MNGERLKGKLEDTYDESKEYTFCSIVRDLYNKKELATLIWVWGNSLVFLALIVFSSIKFFLTDQTKYQIMYAAIFICCVQVIILAKIVCWQTVQKNRITREIKRLVLNNCLKNQI
ncbi:MAG: DUF6768 family protein [Planctomycetota bacterium]|jgi:hypothetical protein